MNLKVFRKLKYVARIKMLHVMQISILCGIILLLIWASVAKLDIVVSARGEVVSESDVEKIQHREGGILDALLVKEGQYVHKGQPIARLRAMERDSELGAMQFEVSELQLEIERLSALIDDFIPDFTKYSRDEELVAFHSKIWREEVEKNRAAEDLLTHDIAHKKGLLSSMRGRLKSSREQLDLIKEQKDIKEQLYREDIIPYIQVLDMRVQEKNMQREIQNLEEAILNEDFSLQKISKQLTEMRASKRAEYLDKRATAQKDISVKREHFPNVQDQVNRLVVTSPIDGFINEIHFNYKSAVIAPGESIADISPVRSALIGEAKIPRKDIGFIEIGQSVRIKVDTFTFTKYGAINGEVTAISKNSYEEDDQTFYIAKLSLARDYLEFAGTPYYIAPDMEFVADIKTGSRSVLDYAVKPIVIALKQSFRER